MEPDGLSLILLAVVRPILCAMIAVLAGGVGAARFARGLVQAVAARDVTMVVNTGDDTQLHGLYISPDIDTVIYTLSNSIDPEKGWGLAGETWRAMSALQRFATTRPESSTAGTTWFNLGDADLATHMYRTARLSEGASLQQVTSEIQQSFAVEATIIPMTNDQVSTQVVLAAHSPIQPNETISFQEYFVKHRHALPVARIDFDGIETASCIALPHLTEADVVIVAPSNPIVSIGPIVSLPHVQATLMKRRDSVVAISPIVAGAALKGPADRMLTELGHDASVVGVARMYAPWCSTLIIDNADAHLVDAVKKEGMECVVTNTIMSSPEIATDLSRVALQAVTS
jgi:LPPG:FO 2-phospho-L-lactate transferase